MCRAGRRGGEPLDAAAGSDRSDVRFENVAGDDSEIGELFCQAAKSRDECRVDFDGVDGSAGGEQVLGDFTMPGSNFDPAMLIFPRERDGGVRRNANGAGDLFAPVEIGEEVLAEALACHAWNSVAGLMKSSSERPDGVGTFAPQLLEIGKMKSRCQPSR